MGRDLWRLSGPSPCSNQGLQGSRLLRAVSSWVLNYCQRHRLHNLSGNLFQCLTNVMGKKFLLLFKWNFLHFSLCPLPLIPSLDTSEKSLALSSLLPPIWYLYTWIRPAPPSLLEDNILINISKILIKYLKIHIYLLWKHFRSIFPDLSMVSTLNTAPNILFRQVPLLLGVSSTAAGDLTSAMLYTFKRYLGKSFSKTFTCSLKCLIRIDTHFNIFYLTLGGFLKFMKFKSNQ